MSLRAKLLKAEPDQLEVNVAQALLDLEMNVADLKADLRPLQVASVKEVLARIISMISDHTHRLPILITR